MAPSKDTNSLYKAIAAHKKYLNPKRLFRRSSAPASEHPQEIIEQYQAKPAWKVLGARKILREAMSDEHEVPQVVEAQSAILSNRLAWKVLAHRRNQRLALSETRDEELVKNLGCLTVNQKRQDVHESLNSFLSEVQKCWPDENSQAPLDGRSLEKALSC